MKLESERLILRQWQEKDRSAFYRMNSDDRVMAFFPFRRTREQADQLMDLLAGNIRRDGFGFAVMALKDNDECIGFCGLSPAGLAPLFPSDAIEIGWRLLPEHWHKGYATEAALQWRQFGFATLGLCEIVSFAVQDNHPSLAVMERIGMHRTPDRDFDHRKVPDTHPHLKRHLAYAMHPCNWATNTSEK